MRLRFAPTKMTKAANQRAFKHWLVSCTDEALDRADAASLARSYGLEVLDAHCAIKEQRIKRRLGL